MEITDTIAPTSEQLNADDLLGGPVTVTITSVERGTKDQPVFIHLAEFAGRTYRPGKSMRRVLIACWGAEASVFVGRRITIYNDPSVKWGGKPVGGIRISHLSHITEAQTVALTVTRGQRAPFVVEPLCERDWITDTRNATTWTDANRLVAAAVKAGTPEETIVTMREFRDELPRPEKAVS